LQEEKEEEEEEEEEEGVLIYDSALQLISNYF
jgi:hypothetical protein